MIFRGIRAKFAALLAMPILIFLAASLATISSSAPGVDEGGCMIDRITNQTWGMAYGLPDICEATRSQDSDFGTDFGIDSCEEWHILCDSWNLLKTRQCCHNECWHGCKNDNCTEWECFAGSDCGIDYYGDNYCEDNKVYNDFHDFSCVSGKCSENSTPIFHFDCGGNYCEEWEYICEQGNSYKARECYGQGCSAGACYSNAGIEKQLVKNCENGCENGECNPLPPAECSKDSDCGEQTSVLICSNGDVNKKIVTPKCIGSSCSSETIYELVENCEYGCENGECKEENDNNGRINLQEDYCGDGFCDKLGWEDEFACPIDCNIKAKISLSLNSNIKDENISTNSSSDIGAIRLENKMLRAERYNNDYSFALILFVAIAIVLFLVLITVMLRKRH